MYPLGYLKLYNMKQLDTDTVLTIIKMLDAEIRMNNDIISTDSTLKIEDIDCIIHESWGLEKFRDHLQSYIEGLVSQAENNLNAGE